MRLRHLRHEFGRLDGNLRGVLLMVLCTAFGSLTHALVRHMSAELHPFELAFFRNLFGVLPVLPWFMRYGLAPLQTRRFSLHALRAGLSVVAMLALFYALSITPLADATALTFTAPIFATILAVPLLGESVGIRRWAAIVFGFAGIMVLVRPGFEAVGIGLLLVLVYAALWGIALIITKKLGETDSSVTIISYFLILLAPMSAIPAAMVWQTPTFDQLLLLAAIGTSGTIAQLLLIQALKQGETAVVMPFDFLKMIWAVLLGFLLFAEVPGLFTWLGGAMIFGATTYIALRENRSKRGRVR